MEEEEKKEPIYSQVLRWKWEGRTEGRLKKNYIQDSFTSYTKDVWTPLTISMVTGGVLRKKELVTV